MITIKRHHKEDFEGQKALWRTSFVDHEVLGPDGLPSDFREIAIISCPACGVAQGIGSRREKIQPDGKLDVPFLCCNRKCKFTDEIQLEGFDAANVRSEANQKRDHHHKANANARLGFLRHRVRARHEAELNNRVMEEVKKHVRDGRATDPKKFREIMDEFDGKLDLGQK